MKTPNQINLRGLVFRKCRHHLVFMVVWLVMFQCALFAGAVGILEAAKAGDAASRHEFRGTVKGDAIEGTVAVGSGNTQKQYPWTAKMTARAGGAK